jgi:acetylornithine deacetylase/succinyl-diaminopimelate desuccinylase-like protein
VNVSESKKRNEAIAHVKAYFNDGTFKKDLSNLVSFKTESQNSESNNELLRYLTVAILPRLTRLGLICEIFDNPNSSGGPILIGERIESSDYPTIFIYGHGDVVLGQKEQWFDGLDPFTLKERGNKLYGRGTADNKSQHLINIIALETVLSIRKSLGFNVKFVMETSEEIGSPGLREFFKEKKSRLVSDVLIASDGPRLQPDVPTIFMGTRGAMNFDLEVDLRKGDHHSGNWGGVLSDPAIILTNALASISNKKGEIQISAWRPASLTEEIKEILNSLPLENSGDAKIDLNWGERNLTPLERLYGWNSFSILSLTSGNQQKAVNAISGKARASCQLRFVVGTRSKDIIPALRKHLDDLNFKQVKIILHDNQLFEATRLSVKHPWVDLVSASIETTSKKAPHLVPNLAGSLPNDSFTDILKLPTIWIPHSYRGCSQHAPNEHVLKSVCLDALKIMVGVYFDIGEKGSELKTLLKT